MMSRNTIIAQTMAREAIYAQAYVMVAPVGVGVAAELYGDMVMYDFWFLY
jgi:hypothetical protein